MKSLFRIIGLLGLFGGLGSALYYLFLFDTTVEYGVGKYVHNFGLVSQQQNMIIVSIFIIAMGIVSLHYGTKK